MPDHPLSTKVILSGGGASGYGSVAAPTSAQIANMQQAIDDFNAVGDIDSLLPGGTVTIYLVPQSFFEAQHPPWTAGGHKAWGFTPVAGKAFVNNELSLVDQRYAGVHECYHTVDSSKGVMNHAKRATIGAEMRPAPDQTVAGWWGRGYQQAPNENAADAFPQAYGVTGDRTGNFYTRPIPSSSFSAYRTAVGGAGAPASTTLATNATAGQQNIKLVSMTGLSNGDWVIINDVELHQAVTVGTSGSGGTGVTLDSVLTGSYTTGQSVVETSAPSGVSGGTIDQTVARTTPNGGTVNYTMSGLAVGATGQAKIRFYDGKAWGEYSDPVAVSLLVQPGPPVSLSVTPGTLTPDFAFSAPAAATGGIRAYRLLVYKLGTTGGDVLMMDQTVDPLPSPSARVSVGYNGNVGGALQFDQAYKWQVQAKYEFGAGGSAQFTAYSAPQSFTPRADTGPAITYLGNPLDLSYKIDTETPTFRVADQSGGNIDQARLRLWDSSGSALLYDTGLVTFSSAAHRDFAIPAGKLVWGLDFQVDAAVALAGSGLLGNYNPTRFNQHVNAQPGAPAPLSLTVAAATDQVVGPGSDLYTALGRTDGIWVTTAAQPIAVFPNRDVDLDLGYSDPPSRREIELKDMGGTDVGASPYVITSTITDDWPIPAVLAVETEYQVRARYDDAAAVRSAWSDFMFVRYSAAPDLVTVAPYDGTTETDPTPHFLWSYSSSKAQAGFRLVLSIAGQVIYDTGLVLGDASSWQIPAGVLDTAETVDYSFTVYDTDGLSDTGLGTITTAFTVPDVITGLTVTPDLVDDALIATWDASLDAAFSEYLVYIKPDNGDWRLVIAIADVGTTVAYIRAAGHNVDTVVRVTQTNDWAESGPNDVSAMLGGDYGTPDYIPGYWFVRPDNVFQLGHASHGKGDTQTDLETFVPPLRGEPVVLDWGSAGYQASFTFLTRDRDLILQLRAWKEQGLVAILKTWYGAARYVRLTATPDTDQHAALIQGELAYVEVLPANVPF